MCDDENACTFDIHSNGVCLNLPITCDDRDPCTLDQCDVERGCFFPPDPEPEDKCACWWFEFSDPQVSITPPIWTVSSLDVKIAAVLESQKSIHRATIEFEQNAADMHQRYLNLLVFHGSTIPEDRLKRLCAEAEGVAGAFLTEIQREQLALTRMDIEVNPGAFHPMHGHLEVGLVAHPDEAEIRLVVRVRMASWASTDSFPPHGAIWSSWGPGREWFEYLAVSVGCARISVDYNGNYGSARIEAVRDECAESAALPFDVLPDHYEAAVRQASVDAYNAGKRGIAELRERREACERNVSAAIRDLEAIPDCTWIIVPVVQQWGDIRDSLAAVTWRLKIVNCRLLHENYRLAEMLPEKAPPGGCETTNLPFLANTICSPGSGE